MKSQSKVTQPRAQAISLAGLLFLFLSGLNLRALANGEGNGGGDGCVGEFKFLSNKMFTMITNARSKVKSSLPGKSGVDPKGKMAGFVSKLSDADMNNLSKSVEKTIVAVAPNEKLVDGKLLDPVTKLPVLAVNYLASKNQGINTIELSPAWCSSPLDLQKLTTVAHEHFSIIGLEKSQDYQYSSQFFDLTHTTLSDFVEIKDYVTSWSKDCRNKNKVKDLTGEISFGDTKLKITNPYLTKPSRLSQVGFAYLKKELTFEAKVQNKDQSFYFKCEVSVKKDANDNWVPHTENYIMSLDGTYKHEFSAFKLCLSNFDYVEALANLYKVKMSSAESYAEFMRLKKKQNNDKEQCATAETEWDKNLKFVFDSKSTNSELSIYLRNVGVEVTEKTNGKLGSKVSRVPLSIKSADLLCESLGYDEAAYDNEIYLYDQRPQRAKGAVLSSDADGKIISLEGYENDSPVIKNLVCRSRDPYRAKPHLPNHDIRKLQDEDNVSFYVINNPRFYFTGREIPVVNRSQDITQLCRIFGYDTAYTKDSASFRQDSLARGMIAVESKAPSYANYCFPQECFTINKVEDFLVPDQKRLLCKNRVCLC